MHDVQKHVRCEQARAGIATQDLQCSPGSIAPGLSFEMAQRQCDLAGTAESQQSIGQPSAEEARTARTGGRALLQSALPVHRLPSVLWQIASYLKRVELLLLRLAVRNLAVFRNVELQKRASLQRVPSLLCCMMPFPLQTADCMAQLMPPPAATDLGWLGPREVKVLTTSGGCGNRYSHRMSLEFQARRRLWDILCQYISSCALTQQSLSAHRRL